MQFPIDLVITWVRGQSLRHIFMRNLYRLREETSRDNSWVRWVDHGLLKYSLRSVQKNGTFFRKIFIVCMDGQSPPWLIESDSIKIIYHSEIISAEFLPTFCSTVIESSLHKIPGLAEHFVYNNDDCLFWGKVDSSTFMNDRDPIIHLNDVVSQSGEILPSDSGHIAGIKNANKLLDRKFGQKSRKECHHFSQLMTKSACELAWNYFESDILRSLVNKFRSANSIAFTNHLVPHLMIELDQARFSSCGTKGVGISFRSFRILNHIVNALKYGGQRGEDRAMATLASIPDLTFLVIDGDATTVSKILNNWFAEPSEFEKS